MLQVVQEIITAYKDNPVVYPSMPPTACALIWCRGLMERISEPLVRIETLNKGLLETPNAKYARAAGEARSAAVRRRGRRGRPHHPSAHPPSSACPPPPFLSFHSLRQTFLPRRWRMRILSLKI